MNFGEAEVEFWWHGGGISRGWGEVWWEMVERKRYLEGSLGTRSLVSGMAEKWGGWASSWCRRMLGGEFGGSQDAELSAIQFERSD